MDWPKNITIEEIKPFKDGLDHLVAEMGVIRLMLADKVTRLAKRFESEMESTFRGYGITPAEALYHLKNAEGGAEAANYSFDQDLIEALKLKVEKSFNDNIDLPLVRLQKLFKLSSFEINILVTCLLPEFYPGLGRVFGFLQDDATLVYPTMGLISELYCKGHMELKFAWHSFHPGSTLRTWNLIAPIGDEAQIPPLKRAYRADERIITFLMGSNDYDGRLEGKIILAGARETQASVKHKSALENIAGGVMDGRECQIVMLSGPNEDSANDFVEATAGYLGWKILRAPAASFYIRNEWDIKTIEVLLREAVLQPAVLFFYEEKEMSGEPMPDMTFLGKIFARKGMLIFIQSSKMMIPSEGFESSINYLKLEFDNPPALERVACWEEAIAANNFNWPPHVAEQLAMRYSVSKNLANTLLARLRLRMNGDNKDEQRSLDLFRQIINDYTRQPLGELAQRIEPVFDWNDLVVHKSVAEHLKAFRNTIAHQFTVYERWGLGAKTPRGRGVVALFSGPSGTGKTMAAEVIAHDLGINLYRIDLAGLVSKYIGETEKNIKRIFDCARSNVLLFFDEADSLFGRRTEIKDSHDRYANLEVNYLLQRLEDHDGPVILATNIRKNMDEAFLRRIHFVIEFPQPSEPLRQIIFNKYLPGSVPKAGDVDIQFLAKHFEISGGDIKNAAIHAAFMAAEEGELLKMEHLLISLKREYLKLGKLFPGSHVGHIIKDQSERPEDRRRKKEASRLGT
jgi:DNA polymerase III delta prime subunit